jgi:hypothetical protein
MSVRVEGLRLASDSIHPHALALVEVHIAPMFLGPPAMLWPPGGRRCQNPR